MTNHMFDGRIWHMTVAVVGTGANDWCGLVLDGCHFLWQPIAPLPLRHHPLLLPHPHLHPRLLPLPPLVNCYDSNRIDDDGFYDNTPFPTKSIRTGCDMLQPPAVEPK